jgi:hypothetical protein
MIKERSIAGRSRRKRLQPNFLIASEAITMTTHLIDFNRLEVYEAGALLVTLLAYPDASDKTQGDVHASLCTYALRIRSAIEPDWHNLPQPIKPLYALRSERDCNRDLRTLVRRWRDRMVAGRMGIAFLREALPGHVLKLPPGVKRLSINQLAELVLDDTRFTDAHNVETRIWRPSLPVVHLASAIQVYLTLSEAGTPLIGLEMLLLSRTMIEGVVAGAAYHEMLMAQSRHLHFDPEKTIRIRLA